MAQIPVGAKIVKVTLILTPVYSYAASVYKGGERICVYQLAVENAAWEEGAGESLKDPDNDPIAAPGANGAYVNMEAYTDDSRHDGVRWLSGQNFGIMDFSGDELGSYSLEEFGITKSQAIEIALPPKMIEEWQKDPELAKAGLVLWMTSGDSVVEESRFALFMSREQEASPRLVVEYENP